jgi:hypothetical protein
MREIFSNSNLETLSKAFSILGRVNLTGAFMQFKGRRMFGNSNLVRLSTAFTTLDVPN